MPGAIAAVITADLNCVSVSSKFRPAIQTTAGWIISEISTNHYYWSNIALRPVLVENPPIPNSAAGNATAVIISIDA